MKDHPEMLVKLLRTIKNQCGNTMRKGSIVLAEKMYGGYRLNKRRRQKGLGVSITRVHGKDFEILSINKTKSK